MSVTVPSTTDSVAVLADQVVTLGSKASGTIDLRAKIGAYLFIALGRGGATAIGTALTVQVRATLGNNAKGHPNSPNTRTSSTTAASSTTVSADSAAGQAVLTVASGTGFAAGDLICIQDSGGGVTRLEWARISKLSAGTITLDRNLEFAHTAAQADTVRNKADVFPPILLAGGCLHEVICDYGAAATGDSITVRAQAQRIDNFTTT